MINKKLLILALSTLVISQAVYSQSLATTVDPARMDDTTDDTIYLQGLIDGMPNGGVLRVPAGTLTLSDRLVINKISFSIIGVGASCSIIRFETANDGVLAKSSTGDGGMLFLSDFSLITSHAGGGIALETQVVDPTGDIFLPPKILMKRVDVRGEGSGYWNGSILSDSSSLLLIDSFFQGVNNSVNGTLNHIEFVSQTGGGAKLRLIRCHLKGADVGIYVHDNDAEGQFIVDTIVEDVAIGGLRLTPEPAFNWYGCRILASGTGIYLSGARDVPVAGCVVKISGTDGVCFALEKRTMQNFTMLGNILESSGETVRMNEFDIDGIESLLINMVTMTGNYVEGADTVVQVDAKRCDNFRIGGNLLVNVTTEFSLHEETTSVFKTETEEL